MSSMVTEIPGLVSVILPTYNRQRTLYRAISSVLTQSYADLELIVVDDASTDETPAVLARFSDPRLRYVRLERNGGAAHARNHGLGLVRGEFVAFQDSDDEWLAEKLAKQVAAAQGLASPMATVFHTKILYGRDENARYGPHRVCCTPDMTSTPSREELIDLVHRGNIISTQTLLFSRAVLEKVGRFDELLIGVEDWDFAIKLIHNTDVAFIDEPLVMAHLQGDSTSTLRRSGSRSELRIMQKLRRARTIEPAVLGDHLARIGWGVSKLGYPRMARRLLHRSIGLSPGNWRNWARLAVNEGKIFSPVRPRVAPLGR